MRQMRHLITCKQTTDASDASDAKPEKRHIFDNIYAEKQEKGAK